MVSFLPRALHLIPLRVRLTLWYVSLMVLAFFCLGTFFYVRLRQTMLSAVDLSIHMSITQAVSEIQEGGPKVTFENDENEADPEANGNPVPSELDDRQPVDSGAAFARNGSAVRVVSAAGDVWDGIGDYMSLPMWPIESEGYFTGHTRRSVAGLQLGGEELNG